MKSPRSLIRLLAVAFALAMLVAACGGDDSDSSSDGGDGGDGGGESADVTSCDDVTDGVCTDAGDIFFDPTELDAAAGEVSITMINIGQTPHTFLFDDESLSDFKLEVNANGDVDSGSVELEAGEYSFWCDIPGHREAGMEGVLTVS